MSDMRAVRLIPCILSGVVVLLGCLLPLITEPAAFFQAGLMVCAGGYALGESLHRLLRE